MAEPTPNSLTSGLWSTLTSYSDQASSLLQSGYVALTDTATSAQNFVANEVHAAKNSVYQSTESAAESAALLYDSVTTKGVVSTLWTYTPESVKSTAYDVSSSLIGERQVNTLLRSAEVFWNAESGEGLDAVTHLVREEYANELNDVYEVFGQYYESTEQQLNEIFYGQDDHEQKLDLVTDRPVTTQSKIDIPQSETVAESSTEVKSAQMQPARIISQPLAREVEVSHPPIYTWTTESENSSIASTSAEKTLSHDQDSESSNESRILLDVSLESDELNPVPVLVDLDGAVPVAAESISKDAVIGLSYPSTSNPDSTENHESQSAVSSVETLAVDDLCAEQDELKSQNLQTVSGDSTTVEQESYSVQTSHSEDSVNSVVSSHEQSESEEEVHSKQLAARPFSSGDASKVSSEEDTRHEQKSSVHGFAASGRIETEATVVDLFSASEVGGYALQLSEEQYSNISTQRLFQDMLVNLSGFAGRISRKAESVMDTAVEEDLSAKAMDRVYHVVTRNEMTDSDSHPESDPSSEDEQEGVVDQHDEMSSKRPSDVSISFV